MAKCGQSDGEDHTCVASPGNHATCMDGKGHVWPNPNFQEGPRNRHLDPDKRPTKAILMDAQRKTPPEQRAGLIDFDAVDRPHAFAHRGAGDTERGAAELEFPRSRTHRLRCLEALAAAENGLSDPELAAVTGLYLYTAAPRRVELRDGGWVEDSGLRRSTDQGAPAVVWRLTPAGRAAYAQRVALSD